MEYLYPGGRHKALTLSYDDGQVYDRRLVEILNRAGIRATFHLNSGNLDKPGFVTRAELPALYQGHEIACHGVTHRHPLQMTRDEWAAEIWQDRLALEEAGRCIVQGMSYAFGEYDAAIVESLRTFGIRYSRTVESTGRFTLPRDFLRWTPTCHHNDRLAQRTEAFLNTPGYEKMPLFYLWGHSFEFERENTWDRIEAFAGRIGGNPDIWYATNGEVCEYLTAMRNLRPSADGKRLYNPSARTVWFCRGGEIRSVAPGEDCEF